MLYATSKDNNVAIVSTVADGSNLSDTATFPQLKIATHNA